VIQPQLQDDAFLQDVAEAQEDPDHLYLWWLGQSGFLVQWNGAHLLLDPYLSDSLTRKYAATDKPHVRMTARVVAPELLKFVRVVTSSHAHTDHLDAETLGPLLRSNPELELVIPEANRQIVVDRLGLVAEFPRGLEAGQSIQVAGFAIHAVPAAHEALDRDEWGRHRYLGYVIRAGPYVLYHSGDTVLYEGMVDLLRTWAIDVAMLPINGRGLERRVAGNLTGHEAALLAHQISARLVIPCHFDMFEFNTASPAAFIDAARQLGQPCRILRAGERWTSSELPGPRRPATG
jgi:L-ascorbate metabolism protein UlaG (beta-lactamase superfamily)